MNIERAILITFLGDYIIIKILAAIVSLVPGGSASIFSAPYIVYYIISAISVGIFTWWYMMDAPANLRAGIWFGLMGFAVAIVTEFVAGIAGTLSQTGSFSQTLSVIPTFLPFVASWATVAVLAYWVIAAAAAGWWLERGKAK